MRALPGVALTSSRVEGLRLLKCPDCLWVEVVLSPVDFKLFSLSLSGKADSIACRIPVSGGPVLVAAGERGER
jgi:hypothetical protein